MDYINDSFIRLVEEGRIRDAIEFCEKVADSAPYVEFRCIALKDLAECYYFYTGDGDACRKANLRGLELMEANPDIFQGTEHMSKSAIERLYSDFCEQFRSVAVSMEEYELYCEKPLRVRARNSTEQRGLAAVKNMRSQNIGWKENMFGLLDGYYPQSQWTKASPGASQGACLAQLILLNRRSLRTLPLDINFAIQQYSNCIVSLTNNIISSVSQKNFAPVGEQLCFSIERAIEVIEAFRSDRQADGPTVGICLDNLNRFRRVLLEDYGSESVQGNKYLRLQELNNDFDRQMDMLSSLSFRDYDTGSSGSDTPEKPGRLRFIALLLAGVIFFVSWLISKQILS